MTNAMTRVISNCGDNAFEVGRAERAVWNGLAAPSSVQEHNGREADEERQDEQDVERVMTRAVVHGSLLKAA